MNTARSRDWRAQAECRSADPEAFFPAAEAGPAYTAAVVAAKAVCARCPVRCECLDEALARIPEGIAGGMTPEERRALRVSRLSPAGIERATSSELDVLELGLRHGAARLQVRAAGRVLLAAGRPVREVAARCGVTARTAERWARTTPPSTGTTDVAGGAGKGRGGSPALPLVSHTNPRAGTRMEGARSS